MVPGKSQTAVRHKIGPRPRQVHAQANGQSLVASFVFWKGENHALPGWERRGGQIARVYAFKNYYETIAFVNASAWISNQQDHHPDLEVGYNRCTVRYSTHSAGGISERDFICAAKVEVLLS